MGTGTGERGGWGRDDGRSPPPPPPRKIEPDGRWASNVPPMSGRSVDLPARIAFDTSPPTVSRNASAFLRRAVVAMARPFVVAVPSSRGGTFRDETPYLPAVGDEASETTLGAFRQSDARAARLRIARRVRISRGRLSRAGFDVVQMLSHGGDPGDAPRQGAGASRAPDAQRPRVSPRATAQATAASAFGEQLAARVGRERPAAAVRGAQAGRLQAAAARAQVTTRGRRAHGGSREPADETGTFRWGNGGKGRVGRGGLGGSGGLGRGGARVLGPIAAQ